MLSEFEKALSTVALNEYNAYHGYNETDPALMARIKTYWTDMGWNFPGVKGPWSAAFVCWCLKTAGATKTQFAFAPMNAKFVRWAIHNAETGSGLFRAYPVTECTPSVGDIIHTSRPNSKITFKHAADHDDYPSHSAIVVATGHDASGHYAMTVGGNEGDSVRRRRVTLDDEGLIVQNAQRPFICVIQTLK